MNQVTLAKRLGISPSYLNQLERNQRPLTVPLLLRIKEQLGVDVQMFSDSEQAALIADVREVLAASGLENVSPLEVRTLVSNTPDIARTIVELDRRARAAAERADMLTARLGDGHEPTSLTTPGAHDEVRDYLNRRQNHVAELDNAAEAIFLEGGFAIGDVAPRLARRLLERHGVKVVIDHDATRSLQKQRFDPHTRTLYLPDYLRPGQQGFQMGVQLALLEMSDTIDALIADAGFSTEESLRLARVALANYFAGALVMPYTHFLQSAEALLYDIERLAHRFGVGFEAVCHRLSTLQRPGASGLPFFFIRVDRAGNVSKRHSASEFHFSRIGGTCPLWIVYEAFSQPDRVLTQTAEMEDGRRYFCIARQVTNGSVAFGGPRKIFAVSLGCDLRHAHRLVYSGGVDLTQFPAATPIGVGCRVCKRRECPQRAFPALI